MSRIKTIRIEDPNNINNLRTTAQILAEKDKKCKQNSSKQIIDNLKMDLDQMNMNEKLNIDNIDEIVNFNLLDEIKEKMNQIYEQWSQK